MLYQRMPRKGFYDTCVYSNNEGFYLDGIDFNDCIKQLREFANQHPEKWIYYCPLGMKPNFPVPIARYSFEVNFYDTKPTLLMFMWNLFQEGHKNNKKEIINN